MEICLMVEGQEGVTWDEWTALARATEQAGLDGLFRSDHYLSVQGRNDRGSLDAWTTLAALATITERIRLGTMVSPVTFRHPALVAKAVVTVDHVSGGRVELGLGAGWHEAEHRAYGFPFPSMGERMRMLEEQVEVVHRQWTEDDLDFDGRHYRTESLDALPKPVQSPHPPLIVGGLAGPRSSALAARWADEYNTVFASPEECLDRFARVADACRAVDRDPDTLRRSVMTGCVVGDDLDQLRARARVVMDRSGEHGPVEEWLARQRAQWVVGTLDEAIERLRALAEVGVSRVMLQHLAHHDVAMVAQLGELARALA